MAQTGIGAVNLLVNNANYVPPTTSSTGSGFATGGNYISIFALRSRLQAANGTYYTNAKLDQMTVNDMVFALRSIDDRTSICDYMPVSTA